MCKIEPNCLSFDIIDKFFEIDDMHFTCYQIRVPMDQV